LFFFSNERLPRRSGVDSKVNTKKKGDQCQELPSTAPCMYFEKKVQLLSTFVKYKGVGGWVTKDLRWEDVSVKTKYSIVFVFLWFFFEEVTDENYWLNLYV